MTKPHARWWRRPTALVAFAAMVLAPIVGIVYLLSHPLELLLAALCAAAAVAAVWYAITRTGAARVAGLAVAAVALVLALIVLGTAGAIGGLLIVIVLLAVAVAAASVAVGSDLRRVAADTVGWRPAPPPSHPVLLMNPWSGGGKVARFDLAREAESRGIEAVVMQKGDDLVELARGAVARGADVLGMAGGDGSLAIVATIAAEHDLAFVAIPAGTRNHFALDLGVDRDDVVGALDAFSGLERRIDLGKVNGQTFLNNVSLGLYATIVQSPEYRDAKAGTAARMLPELLGPKAEPFDLQFASPAGDVCDGSQMVLVSNNPYLFEHFGEIGSRPRLDGGQIGVAAARIAGPAEATEFVALEVARRPRRFRGWREWAAPTLRIESGGKVYAGIDGEARELDPPLLFSVEPGVLRVRVAAQHPGASPAAAPPWLSRRTLAYLLHVAFGR